MKPTILVPVDDTPISKEALHIADDWAALVTVPQVGLHFRLAAIQALIE